MIVEYEADLLTDVLFSHFSSKCKSEMIEKEYRCASAAIYNVHDPEKRGEEFHRLDAEYFRYCDLHAPFELAIAEEKPALLIEKVVVQSATSYRDEGAELYGEQSPNGTRKLTVVFRIRPSKFNTNSNFIPFVRHEWGHVVDMLDPQFEYDKSLRASGSSPAAIKASHHRFVCLWDIRIDSRISARNCRGARSFDDHAMLFKQLFTELRNSNNAFLQLFNGRILEDSTHSDLYRYAHEPRAFLNLFKDEPQDHIAEESTRPCPLCGFPTTVWATDILGLEKSTLMEIATSNPNWKPSDGLCAHCLEILVARVQA